VKRREALDSKRREHLLIKPYGGNISIAGKGEIERKQTWEGGVGRESTDGSRRRFADGGEQVRGRESTALGKSLNIRITNGGEIKLENITGGRAYSTVDNQKNGIEDPHRDKEWKGKSRLGNRLVVIFFMVLEQKRGCVGGEKDKSQARKLSKRARPKKLPSESAEKKSGGFTGRERLTCGMELLLERNGCVRWEGMLRQREVEANRLCADLVPKPAGKKKRRKGKEIPGILVRGLHKPAPAQSAPTKATGK